MKKVVRTGDLCCKTCAERAAEKLKNVKGVISAKADFKKSVILIETDASASDEEIAAFIRDLGYEVKSIEVRKGLFY